MLLLLSSFYLYFNLVFQSFCKQSFNVYFNYFSNNRLSARLGFWAFVCIQLYLFRGMLFPSFSYFLISDCARRSPGKYSRLFWEPRQFFELVWNLRWYGLCATYEPVHLILLDSLASFTGFPLGFTTLFVIFQGSLAW